jgi:hypothetical protein
MQRFVGWVIASRVRVIVAAVLLAILGLLLFPMMVWVPGALVVFLSLRGSQPLADWRAGMISAVIFGWLWLPIAGPVSALLLAAALIVPPLMAGRLMARGGSLTLAFQFATLAAIAVLVVVHLALADPPGVWQPVIEWMSSELDHMATMMSSSGGGWHPTDAELREAASTFVNWGVVAWLLLFNVIAAAAAGLYLLGCETNTARLGPQFRSLQAGRTLAGIALVVLVLLVATKWNFASDMSRLLLGVMVLQGLALMHAAREALGLNAGWLVIAYVALFISSQRSALVEEALAVIGFMDNWLPFRARLGAVAARYKGRAG